MPSRPLTAAEILMAQSIYGNTIDYSQVQIYNEKFRFWQPDDTAITPYGDIYFPTALYQENFATASPGKKALFIHELGHTFQYQHGMNVVNLRVDQGAKYNYDAIFHGTPFDKLPVEAQTEFLEDLYCKRNGISINPNKEDGPLENPSRSLADYEAVLPSNFVGGNPSVSPVEEYPPYSLPPTNAMLPSLFQGPADAYDKGPSDLLPDWSVPAGGIFGDVPAIPILRGWGDPLVLDLDGDGVEVTKMGFGSDRSMVYFDMDNDGVGDWKTRSPHGGGDDKECGLWLQTYSNNNAEFEKSQAA